MRNNIEKQYLELMKRILEEGTVKKDRTGVGTKSIFGCQLRHDFKDGFPLLTSKKIHIPSVIHELLWFLNGDTNIKYLIENGVNIWTGDAYKRFQNFCKKEYDETGIDVSMSIEEFSDKILADEKFASIWGELGPVYGKQWRDFGGIDQIQQVIDTLKTNPDSRRIMVSAWNVPEIEKAVLPPCHYGFQFWTRDLDVAERIAIAANDERFDPLDFGVGNITDEHVHKIADGYEVPRKGISIIINIRSQDLFLGQPFNIASYAFLLEMIGQQANMLTGEMIINTGDTHLYLNHLDAATEQITRTTYDFPTLKLNKATSIFDYKFEDFKIENYICNSTIKAKLNN